MFAAGILTEPKDVLQMLERKKRTFLIEMASIFEEDISDVLKAGEDIVFSWLDQQFRILEVVYKKIEQINQNKGEKPVVICSSSSIRSNYEHLIKTFDYMPQSFKRVSSYTHHQDDYNYKTSRNLF